jgi:hypothetical protein
MHLQGAAAARNKIRDLLARVAALEVHFTTPPDDVAEQRRRSELIRYAIIPPSDLMLNSFQQV